MLPAAHDIEYFLEVATQKNISRAAERLGISQPSLSVSIKRLENSLNTPLLLRSKNGVELTKAGLALSLKARKLVHDWNELKAETLKSQVELSGVYTLGSHPSVALYTLPFFLPKLLCDFPKLEIKLVHDLSRKITDDIIQFKIDFGLVINPVRHPDLVLTEILRDEVRAWVSPTLDLKSANGKTLICDPELIQTQSLQDKFAKNGITFERVVTSSNLEVISSLCNSGAGVGILPTRVAQTKSHFKLQHHPKLPMCFEDKLYLAFRGDFQKSESSRKLSLLITKSFK